MSKTQKIDYPWPIITPEIEEAVRNQLHTTLGTYDRSGITKEFEDNFRCLHRMPYALVTSSGTAALHSAFYALDIGPGDEVICPDYTFFATCMPLFQLGAIPVLADCDHRGGLLASEIDRLSTERTKAVVITHMWGTPCDMDAIVAACSRLGLKLVEDCSHAHGAQYKGKYVGTFGDVGIWSLQSQKIIAAGEAGILLTSCREYYDKAQLLGHFNKRAIQEMDPSSPLYRYAVTGTGLKMRPSALGLAIANVHLSHLTEWIQAKNRNAARIHNLFRTCEGVTPLSPTDSVDCVCSYYAFAFTVDPLKAKFTKEELVSFFHKEGFVDMDIPKSTSSLKEFPIFQEPISPVYRYEKSPCIRGTYPNSTWISQNLVKLSVPVEDEEGSYGRYFMDSFERIWHKFLSHF